MVQIVHLPFQLRVPLALSLALLVAAAITSAEPIREDDNYIGKHIHTHKEEVDYMWMVEPEQEGDFTKTHCR